MGHAGANSIGREADMWGNRRQRSIRAGIVKGTNRAYGHESQWRQQACGRQFRRMGMPTAIQLTTATSNFWTRALSPKEEGVISDLTKVQYFAVKCESEK